MVARWPCADILASNSFLPDPISNAKREGTKAGSSSSSPPLNRNVTRGRTGGGAAKIGSSSSERVAAIGLSFTATVKPVYKDLLLTDLHFALFGCKIAQGLAEGHRDVSPVAAARCRHAVTAAAGTARNLAKCSELRESQGGRKNKLKNSND
jgi:hypothetical protein